jgi:hypothetical protein
VFLFFFIAPSIVVVIDIGIITNAVAIGVLPFFWIQRENVPGYGFCSVYSIAIKV